MAFKKLGTSIDCEVLTRPNFHHQVNKSRTEVASVTVNLDFCTIHPVDVVMSHGQALCEVPGATPRTTVPGPSSSVSVKSQIHEGEAPAAVTVLDVTPSPESWLGRGLTEGSAEMTEV